MDTVEGAAEFTTETIAFTEATNWTSTFPEISRDISQRTLKVKVITSVVYTLMGIIGLGGNSLVVYAIQTCTPLKIKNQLSNIAILNLAITDSITISWICLPAAITVLFEEYPFNQYFCRFCTFCNVVTIIATIDFLAIVSLDRYFLCLGRGVYPPYVTPERFTCAAALVWVGCILVGFAYISQPDLIVFDFWAGICDMKWTMFGPSNPSGYALGWYCILFHFIVPTSAIVYSNVQIIRVTGKVGHVSEIKVVKVRSTLWTTTEWSGVEEHEGAGDAESRETTARMLRTMLIIIGVYTFLTAPVALIRIGKILGGEDGPVEKLPPSLSTLCTMLQFAASIVNPLIYGLFRKDFRDAYFKIFRIKVKATKPLEVVRSRHSSARSQNPQSVKI